MPSLAVFMFQIGVGLSCLTHSLSGLTVGTTLHCSVRREISPCTCQPAYMFRPGTKITCEGMANFTQVLHALQNQFEADHEVRLLITYSKLEDLPEFSFKQLGLSMKTLHLDHDNLSILPEAVFFGLDGVEYLSLADNSLPAVPHRILKQMPLIKTLDLGYGFIQNVTETDFQPLTQLRYLNLASNRISHLEGNSMPRTLRKLHLGHNRLSDLNGTLRALSHLEWLFLNDNNLTSLDNQFPEIIPNNKLHTLFISNNRLRNLPLELRFMQVLDALFASNNDMKGLDGTLAKARKLRIVDLTHNQINLLKEDDFSEAEAIEVLNLAFNEIQALNSSLLPLRALKQLNLTHNNLKEFSLQDIKGLRQLRLVDLSHNKISKLGGRMENLVEMETRVFELRLEHNELESLSGSLMGLTGLHRLNISHNRLETISPDDLIGLDDLHILDVSHNRLATLEETSKTFLPSLEELLASHNALTALERDFHGLPVLCWADLSHNRITSMSKELAEKTQCRMHGVNSTLRIYLQGNPVLCNEKISETILAMESKNNTKIHGMTECIVQITTTTESQHDVEEFNSTAALLEPEVIAAQPQPLIASQVQTT